MKDSELKARQQAEVARARADEAARQAEAQAEIGGVSQAQAELEHLRAKLNLAQAQLKQAEAELERKVREMAPNSTQALRDRMLQKQASVLNEVKAQMDDADKSLAQLEVEHMRRLLKTDELSPAQREAMQLKLEWLSNELATSKARPATTSSAADSVEVIRLRNSTAADVARVLSELFNNPGEGPDRVRVIADPVSNTLLIRAAPADFATIRQLIEQALDASSERPVNPSKAPSKTKTPAKPNEGSSSETPGAGKAPSLGSDAGHATGAATAMFHALSG